MAHIQDRGRDARLRWQARYRAADGRERTKSFGRKIDAERWLSTQTADQARGEWVDPALGRITFAEFAARWRLSLTGLRPTTRTRNLGIVDNHLLSLFGSTPLARITALDIKGMLADDIANLSSASARKHVLVLRGILDEAVREGRLGRNPAADVKLPPEQSRPMRVLEPGQVVDLAETFPAHYRPLVLTAAFVGLRWGELAGLRVGNVDPLRRTITVSEQLIEVSGHLEWGPPKTQSAVRTVSVPSTVAETVGEHMATKAVRMSGLVFPTVQGRPLRRSNFRRRWKPRVERLFGGAELDGLVFHELRHTAASLAIAEGAHPLTVKERLGHSSITVTMDRYGHMFPAQDEAVAEALDRRLRESLAERSRNRGDETGRIRELRP